MRPARVSGVILAAGPSRRFGSSPPKQLALIDGQPLVRRTVLEAQRSELAELIVVVGWQAADVTSAVRDLDVRVVENSRFAEGQSTSVRVGLKAVSADMEAAMFVPIDQPRLSAAVIDAMIACYAQTGAAILVPTAEGRRGAPVLFDRAMFSELGEVEGDVGGRQLFAEYEGSITEMPLATREPLLDVDTPDDLEKMVG